MSATCSPAKRPWDRCPLRPAPRESACDLGCGRPGLLNSSLPQRTPHERHDDVESCELADVRLIDDLVAFLIILDQVAFDQPGPVQLEPSGDHLVPDVALEGVRVQGPDISRDGDDGLQPVLVVASSFETLDERSLDVLRHGGLLRIALAAS